MKPILSTLLALTMLTSSVLCQENAPKPPVSALIVFDASGSMWGQIKGRAKIEIAREVVGALVRDLPSETELGLMAYGHRHKGDCQDIELLIPVGKVDKPAFIQTVNGIMPKGMTPITASLELAAEGLGYTENKTTVILVSDGLETCDADPCAAAKKLEQLGVDFTAHVIAFDLKPEETQKLRCISDATGGKFFPASDAASLKDALDFAVSAAASKPEPVAEDARTAILTAPAKATAGSEIEISWQVETGNGDYITIARVGTPDNVNSGFAYTHGKKASPLTTLIEAGDAEVRYISGITGKVLGRAPVQLTEFSITLKAPAEVAAGSPVKVDWTGPGYDRDYITIVPKSTKDGEYEKWAYARSGNPLEVVATYTPGEAEIRYMNEQGNTVLGRQPIKIIENPITMKAPAEAVAGTKVSIEWKGPDNKGDYLTIVPKGTKDGVYQKWSYTHDGSPLDVIATRTSGEAEIRYMNEDGNKVLARTAILITEPVITMKAAAKAIAGEKISVDWTGPDAPGDYITIVPKSAEDGVYKDYAYTRNGTPASINAGEEPGEAEIRYMNEDGNIVLARIPITIIAAETDK